MTQATTLTPDSDPHATAPECDVLVVGGGPAGATVATLLARQGRQVVLLEKAHHPRFHIGESLLPANVPLLEQLGVRDAGRSHRHAQVGRRVLLAAAQPPQLCRVRRRLGQVDADGLAGAPRRLRRDPVPQRRRPAAPSRMKAARCARCAFDADGATVDAVLDDGATQHWRAQFVVDASGRDTLLANAERLEAEEPPAQQRRAVRPLPRRRAPARQAAKATSASSGSQHGWFWFIPLADGSTSVGAVCWPHYLKSRDKPLHGVLRRHHRAWRRRWPSGCRARR